MIYIAGEYQYHPLNKKEMVENDHELNKDCFLFTKGVICSANQKFFSVAWQLNTVI